MCHALAGNITYQGPRGARPYVAGDVFLSGRPDDPIRASVTSSLTVDVANIDVSLLDEVAQTAAGPPDHVRLLDYAPVSPATAVRWCQAYEGVRELIDDVDVGLENALYLSSLARFLATATLLTFPNTGVTDPDATDRHDAHPRSLRRAVSFIEANLDRDISPADIAEAAGVTIRALQLTFRRHLDTTPLTYVRRVRLAAAREDLLLADPESTTIALVATRWGFHNLGRFAAAYRTQFGELPSQTLRR